MLDNARYQLRYRIADARTDRIIKEKKIQADAARRQALRDRVHNAIVELLNSHTLAPVGGLVGGRPLVNVLEVNLALRQRMGELAETIR